VLVDEAGGRWRDHGRPEAHVLGVRFTRAGYMSPFEPNRVLAPAHWVFEGTGLRKGSLLGKPGASGWELDKIDPRARPAGLVHLAKGRNRRGAGADMCYFTHAGGGGVFSVGSIAFTRCLAGDAQLTRALRNVMARFVGPLPA
jgi:N,N-dimethylformamidase